MSSTPMRVRSENPRPTPHRPRVMPAETNARPRVVSRSRSYVGDAAVDVAAARAAGIAAIGVTWGAVDRTVLEAAGPDAVVDTVEELREVVGLPASALIPRG